MKNRDVILDFTSLLDVVLLILFFFILYSAFNVKEAETRVEAAQAEYEEKLAALDAEKTGLEKERAGLQTEADKLGEEWDRLLALDENAGRNQQALLAFNNGAMLCFQLRKEDDSEAWELRATRKASAEGEEILVGAVLPGDELYGSILGLFEKAGYGEKEVLIVTFAYDGSVIGTHRLYEDIMKAFRDIQAERKNLYLNAINLSK